MVSRIALVCVCIGLLSNTVRAQAETATAAATRGDLEAFAMRIEAKVEQFQKNADARLTVLEEKVKALSDVQQSGQQALQQIAKLDKDGKTYLRIDASHEPTRNELREAILDVAPKKGTVIIHNRTNSTQSVAVNGTTYDVLANSKRPITVPYQNFEVRTSNNRSLNWNFTYPKTRAVVDIKDVPDWNYASR